MDKQLRKKIFVKIGFLLLNVIVVGVLFAIEKRNNGSIPNLSNAIRSVDGWDYLILAIFMFVGMVVSETISIATLIYASHSGIRLGVAMKAALIGKYYDYITPFSTGGQPFQMSYLARSGIEKSHAYSIPLSKHAVRRVAVCLVILILYIFVGDNSAVGIKIAAYLGLAINLTLPVLVFTFSFLPKAGKAFTAWFVKVGYKLHIVKDREKSLAHIDKLTGEFLVSMKYLSTNIPVGIIVSVCSVAEVICQVSVPFLVLRAFGIGGDLDYLTSIVRGFYQMNAASYVPTPGASGGAEAYFYALYNITTTDGGAFFWAVMLWRSITYYSYLVIGIIINIFDISKSVIKAKLSRQDVSLLDAVVASREEMEQVMSESELSTALDNMRKPSTEPVDTPQEHEPTADSTPSADTQLAPQDTELTDTDESTTSPDN